MNIIIATAVSFLALTFSANDAGAEWIEFSSMNQGNNYQSCDLATGNCTSVEHTLSANEEVDTQISTLRLNDNDCGLDPSSCVLQPEQVDSGDDGKGTMQAFMCLLFGNCY